MKITDTKSNLALKYVTLTFKRKHGVSFYQVITSKFEKLEDYLTCQSN